MMFPVTDRHNQERIPRAFGSGPFYGLFDAFHGNSVSEFKGNPGFLVEYDFVFTTRAHFYQKFSCYSVFEKLMV